MRISDWSSDVCSSDLAVLLQERAALDHQHVLARVEHDARRQPLVLAQAGRLLAVGEAQAGVDLAVDHFRRHCRHLGLVDLAVARSEEHTSELQSLMRISYAVFCLKKNNK